MPSLFVGALLTAACGSVGLRAQELEDGTLKVECDTSLSDCVRRAEEFCGQRRIELLDGRTRDGTIGNGGALTASTIAEVHFVCAAGARVDPGKLLRKKAPAAPAANASSQPAPAPATRACVPGATQACFGAGACRGGQACHADGSGFGPCECVSASGTDPAAPASAPGASPPAAPREGSPSLP